MAAPSGALKIITEVVDQVGFVAVRPTIKACEALADEGFIDIAVLGQFKSGKSSLLNTVVGENLFPVGVVPVTAVVTRVMHGIRHDIRVTHTDGSTESADLADLAAFVTEAANPHNQKQVVTVDAFSCSLSPGLRLVDTPGLGSVFAHNTEATLKWLPYASVALVIVSADRPFSDADRQLVEDARRTAPRVVVILNKVDLLSVTEKEEVTTYIQQMLAKHFDRPIPALPFSSRTESEGWLAQLRGQVIDPVVANLAEERQRSLALKLESAKRACQGYLEVALAAAERSDIERDRLQTAIFTETVHRTYIRDELDLAAEHVLRQTRPAFQQLFGVRQDELAHRLRNGLVSGLPGWRGNLAVQADCYRRWMKDNLLKELMPISQGAADVAEKRENDAEVRFARILAAFRDRIGQNIENAIGVCISPISWTPLQPQLNALPVAVSNPFMTNWELLWWMLPMRLVGGVFRHHLISRIPWEVEKNLARLVSDWCEVTRSAIEQLRNEAVGWVESELATLSRLLQESPTKAVEFRRALAAVSELPNAARVIE